MDVSAAAIRKLMDRPEGEAPVTSVYLSTDGARFPRAADYEARLDGLLREVRKAAEELGGEERIAVLQDADAIATWVRDRFDRGDVRGLGLFASGGELLDTVQVAIGVRNQARVNAAPYVVPLQVLLGRHHHIGFVLVERDKARIGRYRMGRLEEFFGLTSDVHGQHEQGGWSQARFERNIANEVQQHYKEAAEILRDAHADDPFDAVVIAGTRTEAAEFTRQLHSYVAEKVHGEPVALPSRPSIEAIKDALAEAEQALVSQRRSDLLQRLFATQGTAEKGAFGLRHVLEAANQQAIETLFVVEGTGEPGWKSSNGPLALTRDEALAYGGDVAEVEDLVDEAIDVAVRGGAHIEMFRDPVRLDDHPVAALLRF